MARHFGFDFEYESMVCFYRWLFLISIEGNGVEHRFRFTFSKLRFSFLNFAYFVAESFLFRRRFGTKISSLAIGNPLLNRLRKSEASVEKQVDRPGVPKKQPIE